MYAAVQWFATSGRAAIIAGGSRYLAYTPIRSRFRFPYPHRHTYKPHTCTFCVRYEWRYTVTYYYSKRLRMVSLFGSVFLRDWRQVGIVT